MLGLPSTSETASSPKDTSECSQPSPSFQQLSGIFSAQGSWREAMVAAVGTEQSLTPPSSLPQTWLSQSQGLNASTRQQNRLNALGSLALLFPHPSLTASSHRLHSVARAMHGYVGGREGEHVWPVPWGALAVEESSAPRALWAKHSTLACFCPAELPPATWPRILLSGLCSQDQTTAAKNSLGQCKLRPEFPFLSWWTVFSLP